MSEKTIHPKAAEALGGKTPGDLTEPVERVVRDQLDAVGREVRAELRAHLRNRTLKMYAGATAAALYGGAALAIAVGLLLALVLPGWAAFLIVAALLFGLSFGLRSAAQGGRPSGTAGSGGTTGAPETPAAAGAAAQQGPLVTPGAPLVPDEEMPPPPKSAPVVGDAPPPAPSTPPAPPTETDPETPHHRA